MKISPDSVGQDSVSGPGGPRQAIYATLDQAVSSVQNFAVVVLCARSSSPSALGQISIGLAIVAIGVGALQALLGEPLLIHIGQRGVARADAQALSASALRRGLVYGIGLGATCGVVGVATSSDLRGVLWVTAGLLPGAVIVDVIRFTLIAQSRADAALFLDSAWILTWVVALPFATGKSGLAQYGLWGATSYVGCISGLILLRPIWSARPRPDLRSRVSRDSRALLIEYVFLTLSGQVFIFAVAGFVNLRSTAGLRVVNTLFGPLNTLTNAIRAAVLPVAVQAASSQRQTIIIARRISVICATMTSIITVLALLVPKSMGTAVFGKSWKFAVPLLIYVGLQRTLSAAGIGPSNALRAIRRVRAATAVRGVGISATYAIGVVITKLAGLEKGLICTIIGCGLTSLALWLVTLRSPRTAPASRTEQA